MGKPKAEDFANVSKERARLLKAQAEVKELELEEKKGSLVPVETVEEYLTRLVSDARSKFLGLPSRLAPQVVGCNSIAEVKETLERAIFECLDQLASGEGIQKRSKGVEKSSKAQGLRVGRQAPKAVPRVLSRKRKLVHSKG